MFAFVIAPFIIGLAMIVLAVLVFDFTATPTL
jgi:hypothetical protein